MAINPILDRLAPSVISNPRAPIRLYTNQAPVIFWWINKKWKQLKVSNFYWLIIFKIKIFCIIHYLWIPKQDIFGCIGNSNLFLHIENLKIAEIESCGTALTELFDPFFLLYSCFLFFSSIYMHCRYLKKFKYKHLGDLLTKQLIHSPNNIFTEPSISPFSHENHSLCQIYGF